MAIYQLNNINRQAVSDPKGFIEACEAHYRQQIIDTAEKLAARQSVCPIILLNGPSSSGKTTTADRLSRALGKLGIHTERISMDDYYLTRGAFTMPWDEENNVADLESPDCMELPLLHDHLVKLAAGEEISIPTYDFENKRRTETVQTISLDPGEMAIIEGIHSFNDVITGDLEPLATCVYISLASEVALPEGGVLAREQLRFCRRAVRDANFRGATVEQTIAQWRSVRRGERLYIDPYRHHAALEIDSYLPYESCILMNELAQTFAQSADALRAAGLEEICAAAGRFEPVDYAPYIPETSVLHEFIG